MGKKRGSVVDVIEDGVGGGVDLGAGETYNEQEEAEFQQTEEGQHVMLTPVKYGHTHVVLVGMSPLILHRQSQKMKQQMLAKQQNRPFPKTVKIPENEFEDATYYMSDLGNDVPEDDRWQYSDHYAKRYQKGSPTKKARYGIPNMAFKKCLVRGAGIQGLVMTETRRQVAIDGPTLIEVLGERRKREDAVPIGKNGMDLRYRPEWEEWAIVLPLKFDTRFLSVETIWTCLDPAGSCVGVGEWRPSSKKSEGAFGKFKLADPFEKVSLVERGILDAKYLTDEDKAFIASIRAGEQKK